MTILRRTSFLFLCLLPVVVTPVVAARSLRGSPVAMILGGLLFAASVTAAWMLGGRMLVSREFEKRRLALAGWLLLAPWILVSLLWVGIATPWDATPQENVLRYCTLLVGSIAVTGGLVLLKEALADAGERFHSTNGFFTSVLAGAAYVVWTSVQLGAHVTEVNTGHVSASLAELNNVFDSLLFIAGALTYVASAAFAASLGHVRWLGRGCARSYMIASLVALALLAFRGFAFPDPNAASTPWYANAGFIVGIPAVPWILTMLIGVVLLRRAGDVQRIDATSDESS